MNYDIYLVGVGGQGVLTVAELITQAALDQDIPANYYPTKGMAQRGGFVKAQVRLGRTVVGPQIPEGGADLVIAMELSEALKAVRYAKPAAEGPHSNRRSSPYGDAKRDVETLKRSNVLAGEGVTDFLLYGHVWQPTAVMLGKAPYPTREQVEAQVRAAGAHLHYLDPHEIPLYEGVPLPSNVYVLGAAVGLTRLGELLDAARTGRLVETRWRRGVERNRLAFQAGLESRTCSGLLEARRSEPQSDEHSAEAA